MGDKFEVWKYVMQDPDQEWTRYDWVQVHGGSHLLPALWAAAKEKRRGAGAVKIEWR